MGTIAAMGAIYDADHPYTPHTAGAATGPGHVSRTVAMPVYLRLRPRHRGLSAQLGRCCSWALARLRRRKWTLGSFGVLGLRVAQHL